MLEQAERSRFDARFAALWQIKPEAVIPNHDRHAASLAEVGVGGVVRIAGNVYVVTKTATYTETDDKYKKRLDYVVTELVLFSLKTGETRYIEWAIDDELEISFTERKLTKAEIGQRLKYDDGEVVDLDDMDEVVDKEWEVVFAGTTYDYDDDWPARYAASDGRTGFVYFYEFGDSTKGWLTLEAWSNDGKEGGTWEYEVYLSHDLSASAVEIISKG
jgi:hypothetical protein